eukprot:scaffold7741_cov114-Isochrysis_galbana.AAC.3
MGRWVGVIELCVQEEAVRDGIARGGFEEGQPRGQSGGCANAARPSARRTRSSTADPPPHLMPSRSAATPLRTAPKSAGRPVRPRLLAGLSARSLCLTVKCSVWGAQVWGRPHLRRRCEATGARLLPHHHPWRRGEEGRPSVPRNAPSVRPRVQ